MRTTALRGTFTTLPLRKSPSSKRYLHVTMIEEISALPTYATQECVIDWFIRVMEASQKNRIHRKELIECLEELSDQQYHQYQFMPVDICNIIEQWSFKELDCRNESEVETLVLLSHCLAFSVESVQIIRAQSESREMKDELSAMLKHVENGRINPYWDLNSKK